MDERIVAVGLLTERDLSLLGPTLSRVWPVELKPSFNELLGLHRRRVAILAVLDQEHHQEGDDGRSGVDDQLPGVRIAEDRPGCGPDDDHGDSSAEGDRVARAGRGLGRAPGEELAHAARNARATTMVPRSGGQSWISLWGVRPRADGAGAARRDRARHRAAGPTPGQSPA